MVPQTTRAFASSTKGFTLVELIVVITILAILGTIGFLSLQGYSANARDSKRQSDLQNLSKSALVKSTEGLALSSFVDTSVTTYDIADASALIGGLASTSTDYYSGKPKYTVLGVDAENFKDQTLDYPIAVTTRGGGAFQLASTLEKANPNGKTALVVGTYSPRTTAPSITMAVPASATVTITTADIGKFRVGDTVSITGDGTARKIKAISSDGLTITLETASTGGTVFALAQNEIGGLIAATTTQAGTAAAANTPTVNGGTNLVY